MSEASQVSQTQGTAKPGGRDPRVGAGKGNRTPLFGLEGRRTSRCTTPAFLI